MKTLILGVIKVYRVLFSPILRGIFGEGCRYFPTCSEYAYSSVSQYGVLKGLEKSFVRLSTCHPFSRQK